MSRRFTIILTDGEWAKLQGASVAEMRTPSSILRYAMLQYINQHKVVVPEMIKYAPQIPHYKPD